MLNRTFAMKVFECDVIHRPTPDVRSEPHTFEKTPSVDGDVDFVSDRRRTRIKFHIDFFAGV